MQKRALQQSQTKVQMPHHLGDKPGRPYGLGAISGGKRYHIEIVASPSGRITTRDSEGMPCHLHWKNTVLFEEHLLAHYWVLVEIEHWIMRHHMMTVRNYIIMSLVPSDLPSPKDCCCTPPCNHHKTEGVHLVWDMRRIERHKQDTWAIVGTSWLPALL